MVNELGTSNMQDPTDQNEGSSASQPKDLRGWQRLVGNRVTEKDIRDYFDREGFVGSSARFMELELHAIKRPGWQQVFRFRCSVTTEDGERRQCFGAVFDDERYSTEFWLGDTKEGWEEQLESWSQEMITCGRNPKSMVHWMLLGLFAAALSFAVVGCIVSQAGG